jgi:hypothetical protein
MSLEGKIRFRSSALLHVKRNSNPEWKFKKRRKRSLEERVSSRLKFLKFLFAKRAPVIYIACIGGLGSFLKYEHEGPNLVSRERDGGLYVLFIIVLNA